MYAVGSDAITVAGGSAIPAGQTHAVNLHGQLLCRNVRAPFHFPSHSWEADPLGNTCPECLHAVAELERRAQPLADPYPAGPPASQPAPSALLPAPFSETKLVF